MLEKLNIKEKRIKKFAIIFGGALIFPMIGKLLPIIKDLPYNFVNYSLSFLFFVFLFSYIFYSKQNLLHKNITTFFFANLFLALIIIIKGFDSGLFSFALSKSSGLVFSISIIIIFCKYGIFENKKLFFKYFTIFLSFFLFFQYSFSMYESFINVPLGDYQIKVYRMGQLVIPTFPIGMRDPLLLFGITQKSIFGINFPILGLIGQHNGFGVMLIFYNLLFLYAYYIYRKKIYFFSNVVVVLAIISNTTRSALLLILLQDMFFIYFIIIKNRIVKYFTLFLILIIALIFFADIVDKFWGLYQNADTVTPRIIIWEILTNISSFHLSLYSFLFGVPLSNFGDYLTGLDKMSLGSVENQYIFIILYSGILGLVLFIGLLIKYFIKIYKQINYVNKIFLIMIFLSFILEGLFMDNLISYYSYVLFTFLLLWISPFYKISGINPINN